MSEPDKKDHALVVVVDHSGPDAGTADPVER
jgi:hypothetical protein